MDDAFEVLLDAVEGRLAALEAALNDGDHTVLEQRCAELQASLAASLQGSRARAAPLGASLRERLAAARGRIAGQRESVSRAIGSAARAAEVLMPGHDLYDPQGASLRGLRLGTAQA